MFREGILSGFGFFNQTIDGFKEKMAELGYIEGKNIRYDIQKTDVDITAYQNVLKKFIAEKADLIFVFPTEASMEAKKATQGTNIPVLFANANIENTGLIKSVREPGGNITGVRFPGPDIALKNLEIMRELAPHAKRIWIPYRPDYPIVASQLEILRLSAATAGITLLEAPAANAAKIKADLQSRFKPGDIGVDAILFIAEPVASVPDVYAVIGKFAYDHMLPIGGALMETGKYGTVFSVNINPYTVGKQAAPLAEKILKGIPAGAIPVASAESFLQINYQAARKLGLNVSKDLLFQADKVIR